MGYFIEISEIISNVQSSIPFLFQLLQKKDCMQARRNQALSVNLSERLEFYKINIATEPPISIQLQTTCTFVNNRILANSKNSI